MIRNGEPHRTFEELDLENNVDLKPNEAQNLPPVGYAGDNHQAFAKNRLDFLQKKIVFQFRPEEHIEIDTRRLIVLSLAMLMAEYWILFAFQLISYFALDGFWHRARFIPGVILGPIYGVLAVLLVFFSNIKHRALVYILKVLEFLTAFFLLGYLAPHDFGTVSLSYIMILDVILIYLFVS